MTTVKQRSAFAASGLNGQALDPFDQENEVGPGIAVSASGPRSDIDPTRALTGRAYPVQKAGRIDTRVESELIEQPGHRRIQIGDASS